MGLKQTILEILKAFNNCKVEYEPYILNPIEISFTNKAKGCEDMYCVLIKTKKNQFVQ